MNIFVYEINYFLFVVLVTPIGDQGILPVPSTSRGLFRPWDNTENSTNGLILLAEAVDIRISDNHDVEMSVDEVEVPPLVIQAVSQLMDVGDDPVLCPNEPDMATGDDFQHIFSDISEIDFGDPNSEVQDSIFEIDNFISEFEISDALQSESL